MTELLSSRSNYSNYRRVYGDCSGFKVPILGVHLKDLISLNEALPDYVQGDKINLSKLQHLYSNINELLAVHRCSPPFEANKDLLHLLTVGGGRGEGGGWRGRLEGRDVRRPSSDCRHPRTRCPHHKKSAKRVSL